MNYMIFGGNEAIRDMMIKISKKDIIQQIKTHLVRNLDILIDNKKILIIRIDDNNIIHKIDIKLTN